MADLSDQLRDLLGALYRPSAGKAGDIPLLRSGIQSGTHGTTSTGTSAAEVLSATGTGGSPFNLITPVLRSLLGGLPLVSGLLSLFGGGGDAGVPAPPERFTLPPPIRLNAGLFDKGQAVGLIDYSDNSAIRMLEPKLDSSQQTPAVVVNVQAMDSQSFLDRSDDIADAVRKALLNSHPLNDLVGQ